MSCNIRIPLQQIIDDVAAALSDGFIKTDNAVLNDAVLNDVTLRGDITADTAARRALCRLIEACGAKVVDSIEDMLAITEVADGRRVTVGGLQGGDFIYDIDKATINDGGVVINGWVRQIFGNTITVEMFGAQATFNPATGVGFDDRPAIQKAIDYATKVGNVGVEFTQKNYYTGTASGEFAGIGIAVNIGNMITRSKNVWLVGNKASVYQGSPGRLFGVINSENVKISGFNLIGNPGASRSLNQENHALICVNYRSKDVEIVDNYITNGIGDCIYVGGSLIDGGEVGQECEDIYIARNVLKERYGNGVRPYDISSGSDYGTRSRLAIALIDTINVTIEDNDIYGAVDFEPNLDGQHIVGARVRNNRFKSGNVIPKTVLGSDFWHDEPIVKTGGVAIEQGVYFTGVAGNPIIRDNIVEDNTFEYGYIKGGLIYSEGLSVLRNTFQIGNIKMGETSGPNYTSNVIVNGNVTHELRDDADGFIHIGGNTALSTYKDNIYYTEAGASKPMFSGESAGVDKSKNIFTGNTMVGANSAGMFGFTQTVDSVYANNSSTADAIGTTNSQRQFIAILEQTMRETAIAEGAQELFWNQISNIVALSPPIGSSSVITDIKQANEGQMVTIVSKGSAGGTVTFEADKFVTKDTLPAVLGFGKVITFLNLGIYWIEVSRNF